MKKTSWKYLVDVVMFLVMLGIILVGLLLAFVIKEGPTVQANGKYFLGLHRQQWSNIHLILSLLFSGALVFHLILEWSWIKGKTKALFKGAWRPILGTIVAAALLIPLGMWALATKNAPEYAESGIRYMDQHSRDTNILLDRAETPRQDQTSPVSEHKSQEPSRRLESEPATFVITGQMTLRQVEQKTGIQASRILARMRLPANLSRRDTLGRLKRRYRFTLLEMRSAIEALMEKK